MSPTFSPGSFFVVGVGGAVGTLISTGERLAGAPAGAARFGHAGIITSEGGLTVEAQPGGAVVGHISDHHGQPLLISDGPVQRALAARRNSLHQLRRTLLVAYGIDGDRPPPRAGHGMPLTVTESVLRERIVTEARNLLGTPYSLLDYAALAAWHLHLPSAAIRRRVQASGHMLCSQLVDAAYAAAGIQLFDDARLPGDVMPSDLATWAMRFDAQQRHPAGGALR